MKLYLLITILLAAAICRANTWSFSLNGQWTSIDKITDLPGLTWQNQPFETTDVTDDIKTSFSKLYKQYLEYPDQTRIRTMELVDKNHPYLQVYFQNGCFYKIKSKIVTKLQEPAICLTTITPELTANDKIWYYFYFQTEDGTKPARTCGYLVIIDPINKTETLIGYHGKYRDLNISDAELSQNGQHALIRFNFGKRVIPEIMFDLQTKEVLALNPLAFSQLDGNLIVISRPIGHDTKYQLLNIETGESKILWQDSLMRYDFRFSDNTKYLIASTIIPSDDDADLSGISIYHLETDKRFVIFSKEIHLWSKFGIGNSGNITTDRFNFSFEKNTYSIRNFPKGTDAIYTVVAQ